MQGCWKNGTVGKLLGCLAIVILAIPASSCSREAASSSVELPVHAELGANKIGITADNHILWNGHPVNEAQLTALLDETLRMDPEPQLTFQPDQDASYDVSAKVLDIIKASKVTKFGFVGNEIYVEGDEPASPEN